MIYRTIMLIALVAGCCLGCGGDQKGGDRLAVFPVSGEVFAGGEAAVGAMIYLHPDSPHQLPEGARPISSTGIVDESGKFVISTYASADGAPSGNYKATITWPKAVGITGRPDGDDRLRGKYGDPQKSEIVIEVAETPVTVPRIDVATR